jgi:hypothetical protein
MLSESIKDNVKIILMVLTLSCLYHYIINVALY